MSQVGDKRGAEGQLNSGSQSSKRCKSTGQEADARTNVGMSDVQEGHEHISGVETDQTRNIGMTGTVGDEGNLLDTHTSIKIIVARELGLLKDSCARPPRIPHVPGLRRLKKRIAFRGPHPQPVSEEKAQEEDVEHDVLQSASNTDVPVESNNADCTKEQNCEADVIINSVLQDIELGEHSQRGEDHVGSTEVEPQEANTAPAINVVSPAAADPTESSRKADDTEKKGDVAQAGTAGSESTNSGNVNDLVKSFFMTPPVEPLLPGGLDGAYHVQGPNAPIFDETPQ
ncbi:uncharacterized protein LOC100828161 isoform X4 [Brachypodium distachyon]|uniref:uncharacterized protein LOC100828161 isoform X4 n=1 Tax=Brachypodium distachyon TaxID=15368 RepID=UPI000D0CBEFE|nr:uncharacterized protein LOC100828161 isoform X4 [Brachypodium distachyon]|eukprot:XP_024311935.1 uncharacterized protein LOC100828161 isoform X4 [Brachypodium distachyon]